MNVFHRQIEDWKNIKVPVIKIHPETINHPDSEGFTVEWMKNNEVLAGRLRNTKYVSVRKPEDILKVARQVLKEMREEKEKVEVEVDVRGEEMRRDKEKFKSGDFVKSTEDKHEGMYGVVISELGKNVYEVDFGGLGVAFKDGSNMELIIPRYKIKATPEPKFKPKQLVRRKGFADEVYVVFDVRWNGNTWEYSVEEMPESYEPEEKIMLAFSIGDIVKLPYTGVFLEVTDGNCEVNNTVNVDALNNDSECNNWKIVVLAKDRLDR